jgi:uncharacterized membrane protein
MVDTTMSRTEPSRPELIDAAALAVIVALGALVLLDVQGPLRGLLALLFVTFVPGWAVVTNWRSAARSSMIALSVLISLSFSAGAATIALWLHVWHPIGLFYVTAAASAVAIGSSLIRRRARAVSS